MLVKFLLLGDALFDTVDESRSSTLNWTYRMMYSLARLVKPETCFGSSIRRGVLAR